MEQNNERIAYLESNVHHLGNDMSELKSEVKETREGVNNLNVAVTSLVTKLDENLNRQEAMIENANRKNEVLMETLNEAMGDMHKELNAQGQRIAKNENDVKWNKKLTWGGFSLVGIGGMINKWFL